MLLDTSQKPGVIKCKKEENVLPKTGDEKLISK